MDSPHKSNLNKSGWWQFAREIIRNPREVGAAFPSTKKLASAMADEIIHPLTGIVVELGAGTGVVTDALLLSGISNKDIFVIERAKKLCLHLQNRFPDLNIIHGNAIDLRKLLGGQQHHVAAIVSSLPLRSLSKKVVRRIESEIAEVLPPGGRFIQFTYNLSKQSILDIEKLHYLYSKFVWLNLPPARVDIYEKISD